MVEDAADADVEPAQGDWAKADSPDVVGDLLEADVLAAKHIRDAHPIVAPSDAAVGGDLGDLEVSRVLGGEGFKEKERGDGS